MWGTVPSGGTENISVRQSTGTTEVGAKQGQYYRIADSNIQNSDGSYDVDVKAEDSLVLPDSQINVNGTDEGDVVSVKVINVSVEDGSGGTVTPDSVSLSGNDLTINVSTGSAPAGATLMPSGAETVYRTGDDADNRLVNGRTPDFLMLNYTNPFGNTNRFTDELGGSTYTNNIVIDWSTYDNVAGTVLGYYRRLLSSGGVFNFTWDNAIDLALAFSVGTFTTGWRMWNAVEALNIADLGGANCYNYAPFSNAAGGQIVGQIIWTSTTLAASTTQAYYIPNFNYGTKLYQAKTNTNRVIAVRTFTVTGTTLT